MQQYLQILRVPRVAIMFVATVLVRLPLAILGLAVVLYVRDETGSFALAGAAAGGLSLGFAVGIPLQGRLVDRFGLTPLLPTAFLHAAAIGLLIALGPLDPPGELLVVTTFIVGVAFPPAGVVLRTLWPKLLEHDATLVPTAYALDAVVVQMVFVTGPLITAVLTAVISPTAALVVAAAVMIGGTLLFLAADPPTPDTRGKPTGRAGGGLGALKSPGIRTVILATLPIGVGMGAIQVALPAYATDVHEGAVAGILLAIWSATSAVGGLIFGTLHRRTALTALHLRITALVPLSFIPPVLAGPPWTMALLVIPAGALIAPFIATRNELAQGVAPSGTATEALSWPITALTAGISLGSAIAGVLAEEPGWRAALAVAPIAALGGALVVMMRRGTLTAADTSLAAGVPPQPATGPSTSR